MARVSGGPLHSPSHPIPPCFLTLVRQVHSQTFEEGISTPRFLASERIVCIRIDRITPVRDAGAR